MLALFCDQVWLYFYLNSCILGFGCIWVGHVAHFVTSLSLNTHVLSFSLIFNQILILKQFQVTSNPLSRLWIRVWNWGFWVQTSISSNFVWLFWLHFIIWWLCWPLVAKSNVLRHIFGMLSPKPMPKSQGSSFFSNMSMSKLRRIMGLQGLKRRENPNLKFTITCEFRIQIQYGVNNWWSNAKATKLPQHIWCVEIKTFRMVL